MVRLENFDNAPHVPIFCICRSFTMMWIMNYFYETVCVNLLRVLSHLHHWGNSPKKKKRIQCWLQMHCSTQFFDLVPFWQFWDFFSNSLINYMNRLLILFMWLENRDQFTKKQSPQIIWFRVKRIHVWIQPIQLKFLQRQKCSGLIYVHTLKKKTNIYAMYYTQSLGEGPHTSRKIFPHVDKFVWWWIFFVIIK